MGWAKMKRPFQAGQLLSSDIPLVFASLGVVFLLLALKASGVVSDRLFCLFALGLLSMAAWRHSRGGN